MASLEKHRSKEYLGGIVNLLTIDMTHITNNPLHIRRFTNTYGRDGAGCVYQGVRYSPHPYELKQVKRNARANKSGSKLVVSDNDDYKFTRFIDQVGGSIQNAKVSELKVYGDFLDTGITPNPLAYTKRLEHTVNYVEDSDTVGEIIIHTQDPLSRVIQVPRVFFSAGTPNDPNYSLNVFPALDRGVNKERQ
jgi:phage-related protein